MKENSIGVIFFILNNFCLRQPSLINYYGCQQTEQTLLIIHFRQNLLPDPFTHSTVPVVWAILEFFQRNPSGFLWRLLNMDETSLYHYDPQTKQQSMEWWHSGSPRPPKNPSSKIRWKSTCLDVLDQDGILLIDFLPKGPIINAECYSSLLE
jgi:hypothetical protein